MTRFATTLIVLGALLSPVPVLADWHLDGNALADAVHSQHTPKAIADDAGGAIVVWGDEEPIGDYNLFVQRIDARGAAQWGPGGVAICTTDGFQWEYEVVTDGAGGVIVAWQDERAGNSDIYAQRVSAGGVPLWTAEGVAVCNTVALQQAPTLVSDLAGGAVISWQDNRGATDFDIYTQRVDATGQRQWTADGVELVRGALAQTNPVSLSDGLGGAIVVFEDFRNDTSGDLYVRGVNANGIPTGTNGGRALCAAIGTQRDPVMASDGGQGAIVVWQDDRFNEWNIYAQRISSGGVSQWAADGVAACLFSDNQYNPACIMDGAGGVIVSWQDDRSGTANRDVYAQRLNGAGNRLWLWNGLPVAEAAGDQDEVQMLSDGDGGAFLTWEDSRASYSDIYAGHVDAGGLLHWSPGGTPVCQAYYYQATPQILADGSGGALIVWGDGRPVDHGVIYAQRVEGRYGEWGHPEAIVESVADNPGDEGGQVIVRWRASGRDRFDDPLIDFYSLWRATDPGAAIQGDAVANPATLGADFSGSLLWRDGNETYWEWVANQSAAYLSAYSLLAPTRQDSLAGDPATHEFMVLAHDRSSPVRIWESNTSAGHSVDNLPPAEPLNLVAARLGANVELNWTAVPSEDLRHYAVYRSATPGVQPVPENFVAWAEQPFLVDISAPDSDLYYVVSAVDVHDNEGPPSNEASVLGETAAGDLSAPRALTVRPNWPNPFRGVTALSIGLPVASDLRVSLFDVNGRRVALEQLQGVAAGWRSLDLGSRARNGRSLPSGIYLYRVEACGAAIAGKMTITR